MKLTLDQLAAGLRECGCCEPPLCCPPLVECQSGSGVATAQGYLPGGSGSGSDDLDWQRTRYLRRVYTVRGGDISPTTYNFPDMSGTYESGGTEAGWEIRTIYEISEPFEASVSGANFAGTCQESPPAEEVNRCEYSGGWTTTGRSYYDDDDGYHSFVSSTEVGVISDASGEVRPSWTAWESDAAAWDTAHPDYAAEHSAWEAAHTTWETDYEDWIAGGEVGDEPVEPEEPPARPTEPDKYYPPCTRRETVTFSAWKYSAGSVVPYGDPYPYTLVTINGGLEGDPLPGETTYEEPVTYQEFLDAANAWLDARANFDNAEGSGSIGSDYCPPGNLCQASRKMMQFGDAGQIRTDYFRYRIKLNKCCAWKSIRSEWSQVFFPAEWLEWLAIKTAARGSDPISDEPISQPVKTPQVWAWSGTPPRCDGSGSGSGSGDVDPYDYEPMWSPWSPVIVVPADTEGIIANRNYQQKCYDAPPQKMPGIFGSYEHDSGSGT